ncbi:energy-coupling factor transporter transmembrane component T family protein [Peptoniphilus lacrimalis]|uniref:Energy-coupling factor transporter transmembrane protein EcfT n=1 Tax=Peptoniphilus lacrimalis TaxID=33031 RepID=A0A379C4J6_9FIRM|nr:energy-coupling factor transporter transmembrane component T [Peptoniphilus lacrimalis]MDK7722119.1 energy-coupling factor transporter transmembrane component T [Peptoniphilus lacrimalis]MDK7731635.1 energy-coupling factor transporter transmembrane component T [Peptoniphilus lacrimalis]SUB57029.1 Energy-coupling factor transporter transmembrane protein EcfT [Peptoniphilus lacrimalis]
MFKDITIGQYFPGESIVHRFDPRLKIITMIFFIISLFFINTFIPYIFVAIYLFIIIKIGNLPLKVVLKGLKPLRWILLITFVINIFFLPGEPLFKLGFLTISKEGLKTACLMAIRLMFLVLGTSLLTYTTSPIELTDGIEALLKPMKKIGVPSHEIAMMMTIALRFIPTLIEETDKIMKAQMARGADFESGNIIKRSKNLVPLLVPLFVNSFRRADELATAMEARCYRGGVGRTKMKVLVLEKYDYAIFLGNIVFFLILILAARL